MVVDREKWISFELFRHHLKVRGAIDGQVFEKLLHAPFERVVVLQILLSHEIGRYRCVRRLNDDGLFP